MLRNPQIDALLTQLTTTVTCKSIENANQKNNEQDEKKQEAEIKEASWGGRESSMISSSALPFVRTMYSRLQTRYRNQFESRGRIPGIFNEIQQFLRGAIADEEKKPKPDSDYIWQHQVALRLFTLPRSSTGESYFYLGDNRTRAATVPIVHAINLQEYLAYVWLAATDTQAVLRPQYERMLNTLPDPVTRAQKKKQLINEMIEQNFVFNLFDIRREHNSDLPDWEKDKNNDRPSCLGGTLGRIVFKMASHVAITRLTNIESAEEVDRLATQQALAEEPTIADFQSIPDEIGRYLITQIDLADQQTQKAIYAFFTTFLNGGIEPLPESCTPTERQDYERNLNEYKMNEMRYQQFIIDINIPLLYSHLSDKIPHLSSNVRQYSDIESLFNQTIGAVFESLSTDNIIKEGYEKIFLNPASNQLVNRFRKPGAILLQQEGMESAVNNSQEALYFREKQADLSYQYASYDLLVSNEIRRTLLLFDTIKRSNPVPDTLIQIWRVQQEKTLSKIAFWQEELMHSTNPALLAANDSLDDIITRLQTQIARDVQYSFEQKVIPPILKWRAAHKESIQNLNNKHEDILHSIAHFKRFLTYTENYLTSQEHLSHYPARKMQIKSFHEAADKSMLNAITAQAEVLNKIIAKHPAQAEITWSDEIANQIALGNEKERDRIILLWNSCHPLTDNQKKCFIHSIMEKAISLSWMDKVSTTCLLYDKIQIPFNPTNLLELFVQISWKTAIAAYLSNQEKEDALQQAKEWLKQKSADYYKEAMKMFNTLLASKLPATNSNESWMQKKSAITLLTRIFQDNTRDLSLDLGYFAAQDFNDLVKQSNQIFPIQDQKNTYEAAGLPVYFATLNETTNVTSLVPKDFFKPNFDRWFSVLTSIALSEQRSIEKLKIKSFLVLTLCRNLSLTDIRLKDKECIEHLVDTYLTNSANNGPLDLTSQAAFEIQLQCLATHFCSLLTSLRPLSTLFLTGHVRLMDRGESLSFMHRQANNHIPAGCLFRVSVTQPTSIAVSYKNNNEEKHSFVPSKDGTASPFPSDYFFINNIQSPISSTFTLLSPKLITEQLDAIKSNYPFYDDLALVPFNQIAETQTQATSAFAAQENAVVKKQSIDNRLLQAVRQRERSAYQFVRSSTTIFSTNPPREEGARSMDDKVHVTENKF